MGVLVSGRHMLKRGLTALIYYCIISCSSSFPWLITLYNDVNLCIELFWNLQYDLTVRYWLFIFVSEFGKFPFFFCLTVFFFRLHVYCDIFSSLRYFLLFNSLSVSFCVVIFFVFFYKYNNLRVSQLSFPSAYSL